MGSPTPFGLVLHSAQRPLFPSVEGGLNKGWTNIECFKSFFPKCVNVLRLFGSQGVLLMKNLMAIMSLEDNSTFLCGKFYQSA